MKKKRIVSILMVILVMFSVCCLFTGCVDNTSESENTKTAIKSSEEIVDNANIMKENPNLIIVTEPFLLDDELREKATKWVEWANKADPKEYDLFVE